MGKRSDFKRIEKDAYDTPIEAVAPLLPHLDAGARFIEPCVGKGLLAGHLERAGHVLVGAYDLPDDARVKRYAVPAGAIFITNPPYWGQRADLHPLIENHSDQAPTWLLLPSDWSFNLSSGLLMSRLRVIVAVGRVKWMPGSKFSGMENAAWLLFERPSASALTRFIGRCAKAAA